MISFRINNQNNRTRLRVVASSVFLAVLFFLTIWLKSGYYQTMPFLHDRDTYFHGMLTNYIVQYERTTLNTPYEVPTIGSGTTLSFHILLAQIHLVTAVTVVTIIRWVGVIMSAFVGLTIYVLILRLSKKQATALFGFVLFLFTPYLSARLSASFPENILIFYIPVVLFLLHDAVDRRQRGSLFGTVLLSISAIGYHFSSYLLMPILGFGTILFYVGNHWRYRNLLYITLFIIAMTGLISIIFSSWWLFGFITSLFKSNSGTAFSADSTLKSYVLPPPASGQWIEQLGAIMIILSLIGLVLFLIQRNTTWRSKSLIIGYTFVILLPLQILPYFKLFSYTPFRAFAYIAIPMVVIASFTIQWLLSKKSFIFKIGTLACLLIILVPNYSTPAVAGAGEQHLTKGEFHGFQWLINHTSQDTLVITAPANGRQIAFYIKSPVAYDTGQGVFDAKTSRDAITEIEKIGHYRETYIYISKYKLGPVYNFGWIREYAYVRADITKFKDENNFQKVYEDQDSLIYRAELTSIN